MELYLLAGAIGFIIAKIFTLPRTAPFFQEIVLANVKEGKKVIIAIEDDAVIFTMEDNLLKIRKAKLDLEYTNDLPVASGELDQSYGVDHNLPKT